MEHVASYFPWCVVFFILTFLSVWDYAKHAHLPELEEPEGKAAVSEVKKWMDETGEALDGRPFYPQSVQKIKKVSWRLESMYQVLSSAEFKALVGRDPQVKDPKLQVLEMQTEEGEVDKFYLFKPEGGVKRNLYMVQEFGEECRDNLMESTKHLHEAQGQQMMITARSSRLNASGDVNPKAALPTLQEHLSKLGKHLQSAAVPTPAAKPLSLAAVEAEPLLEADDDDENDRDGAESSLTSVVEPSFQPSLARATTLQNAGSSQKSARPPWLRTNSGKFKPSARLSQPGASTCSASLADGASAAGWDVRSVRTSGESGPAEEVKKCKDQILEWEQHL
eukprot:1664185-Amphidinium_carterae.1